MAFCPVCKAEVPESANNCPVCAADISASDANWVTLGFIEDKISADYALESLKSYEIPAVIFSRSGYFGAVGLTLNPFYNSNSAQFEIKVPEAAKEEALDILKMTLGERFKPEEM